MTGPPRLPHTAEGKAGGERERGEGGGRHGGSTDGGTESSTQTDLYNEKKTHVHSNMLPRGRSAFIQFANWSAEEEKKQKKPPVDASPSEARHLASGSAQGVQRPRGGDRNPPGSGFKRDTRQAGRGRGRAKGGPGGGCFKTQNRGPESSALNSRTLNTRGKRRGTYIQGHLCSVPLHRLSIHQKPGEETVTVRCRDNKQQQQQTGHTSFITTPPLK